ncbi:RNA polymerase sigma factor [Patescibacteria group bacterium]|nr:RNA polymerase sigma factor [Patescibacteria group bacterium]
MAVNLTDAQLVAETLRHPHMFREIVQRYEAPLLRYIRRLGLHDEAEDILQDSFLKAYRYLGSFDPSLKFSSWMYRIAHNTAMSAHRARQVRPVVERSEESQKAYDSMAAELDVSQDLDQEILKEHLEEALARIDKKYQAVIVLRYFEERTYDEISDILRLPVKTVGTLLHRAKKQLQDKVTPGL